jgi:uncharacterized protein YeaO (DUF488 family)
VAKATARIRTKRVYDPPSADEGTRVLIMRLWPRGIRKDRIDLWLRELGPVLPLLRAFRAGAVPWPEYTRRYLEGLERPEARADVDRILSLARQRPVTILCGCADEAHCHRSLLARHLSARLLA